MISPFAACIFVILSLGFFGLPIGYSMIAGSILYLLLANLDLGTSAEQILNGLYNSYVLLAVPLFLFSAELMNVSKMTDHLLRFCDMLVGRFRGGLGHINIVQSIIFAGMSGSAIADLAATGRISIDMMTRHNRYPVSYAAAITAASAVIGPIIPPSIPMVLYALVSDTSVGYLFLGGIIPGLLMALAQMVINTVQAHRHDYPVEPPIPLREWPGITITALPALLMPVILLGGIYGGVMTPTEAAAVAAAYAFLVAVFWYRNVTAREAYQAVLNSSRSTAAIGMLIAGALVFNYVVTIEQIPQTVRGLLSGYDFSATMFLVWVNVILLVLGCLLEGSTIILVILPILIPTAKALGIDLVHFGVVTVFNIMIGLITPPYGLLLFIASAISGAPLRAIIRDTMPFVLAMIVALAIITFIPGHRALVAAVAGIQGLGKELVVQQRMLAGLIGANIQKSLSPALQEDACAAAGIRGHYHLMDLDVLPGRNLEILLDAARTAGFAGVNVTFPCKEAVLPLLDAVSPEARQIGAVNTVIFDGRGRTTGHNTDRIGFRRAFEDALGRDLVGGKTALLVGAGGAGRAVAFALFDLGAHAVRVHDQSLERALRLADELVSAFGAGRSEAVADARRRSPMRPEWSTPPLWACSVSLACPCRSMSLRPIIGWRTSSTRRSRRTWSKPRAPRDARRWVGAACACIKQPKPSGCLPDARPIFSACSAHSPKLPPSEIGCSKDRPVSRRRDPCKPRSRPCR